ncbi:uncharacterized protein TNCV_2232601 [Trichonephila clavipes]|nr:uncharacterized protein TNCV_2232601 [Trichonephila clavipes]
MTERSGRQNVKKVVFTDESRICLQHHDVRLQRYWISFLHSSTTQCRYLIQSALHLRGVRASCPSLPSGLGHSHISTGYCTTDVVSIVQRLFFNSQFELLSWPAHSPDLSPIENMWSMGAQRFTQITPPVATPDQL